MKTIEYESLLALIRETISEANKTQDKRLRSFTNKITRSIMALYSGRNSELSYNQITSEELGVDPNTKAGEIYEIEAGAFPVAFDPNSIDLEMYEDGIDPFLTVVVEIDKSAHGFNVAGSDKSITGLSDIGIHIAIETPPGFANDKLGELRDEVANAIRHELEHVTQGEESDQPGRAYGRDEKYYQFLYAPKDVNTELAKYLLKPAEIPAHIRGYTQNSKNINQLKSSIDGLLSGYVDQNLIDSREKEIVFETWVDWVQNNINRKGF